MKNIKGDILWGAALLIWILILAIPSSRVIFIALTEHRPYISGFLKFFILASMGDLLGVRISKNQWIIPNGFIFKAALWGILGMAITLLFTVYSSGTASAQVAGKLPLSDSPFARAFFASTIMNLTFGPMMYIYHKFGDLFIDLHYENREGKITLRDMVDKVDWYTMVSFSWLETCIFIWIPCHTLVFLIPSEFRVLASAFLSILLGMLVAISKKRTEKPELRKKVC